MDNLQQHYLLQLAAAQTAYLNGKIGECRDICFELRLQPDLAMYTRARLCVTICDITSVEDYANKLDIANDALRIAIELQEDDDPRKDAVWNLRYARLYEDAQRAVSRTERELNEYREFLQDKEKKGEELFDDSEDGYNWIPVESAGNDHKVLVTPWTVEGKFTRYPVKLGLGAEPEPVSDIDEDIDMNVVSGTQESLPGAPIVIRPRLDRHHLTPPSSSPLQLESTTEDDNDEIQYAISDHRLI